MEDRSAPSTNAEVENYWAATKAPYYWLAPTQGCFCVAGETRAEFLQRQTTNDLNALALNGANVTVLTSATARILDVLVLINQGDTLLALPLPGRITATIQFLSSRIFFMDRVTIADVSTSVAAVLIGGKESARLAEQLGGVTSMMPGRMYRLPCEYPATVVQLAMPYIASHLVLVAREHQRDFLQWLSSVGAVELTESVRETLRIESGIPGADAELTEDYTPLEADLRYAISSSKGCYTGQEIIARQVTYAKIARKLVGLKFSDLASQGDLITLDGKQIGMVTSVASSPRYGPIGLGYVRRSFSDVGTHVLIGSGSRQVTASIHNLPFDVA